MKNNYKRWTPESEAQLIQLFHINPSPKAIAGMLNRSQASISNRLHLLGLSSKSTAVAVSTVKSSGVVPRNHNERWSSFQDLRLRKLFQMGYDASMIAASLGRTISSVCCRLRDQRLLKFDSVTLSYYKGQQLFYKA